MTRFLPALTRLAILVFSCGVVVGVGYGFVLEPRQQRQDLPPWWMLEHLELGISEANEARKALPFFREEVRRLEQEAEKLLPTASAGGGISELFLQLSRISSSSGVTLQRNAPSPGVEDSDIAIGITVSGSTREVLAFFAALAEDEYPFLSDELQLFFVKGATEVLRAELVVSSPLEELGQVMALAAGGRARTPGEEETAEGIDEETAEGIDEETAEGIEEKTAEGIVFVRVRGGSFRMGYRWKQHQVTLSEFWIGKYEVTNEQYGVADAAHPANLPANGISWTQARDFCERLGFRLPTEAEWEYAARAGSQTVWSFGNDASVLGEYAWFWANSGMRPHEVGTKKANAWGIHDMHGNVREWVADWYWPYMAEAQTNPQGPRKGPGRVQRGGAFNVRPYTKLSVARRRYSPPETMLWNVGFRCARDSGRRP